MVKRIDDETVGALSPPRTSKVDLLCIVSLIITFGCGGLWWKEALTSSSSMDNLQQMHMVFQMYAAEHAEYPPLTRYAGHWMVDLETVFPEYLSDLEILVDPRSHYSVELREEMKRLAAQEPVDWEAITRLASWNYVYLPWELRSEEEFALVAKHISGLPRDGQPLGGPLQIGDRTFVPQTQVPEAAAMPSGTISPEESSEATRIPVMFENANVLRGRPRNIGVFYANGSGGLVRDRARFPGTEATQSLIGYAAPHRTDGTPFQTIFDRKKLAVVTSLSAPIVLGVILLLVSFAGRIGVFAPFAVFMLYPPYMAVASHMADLPLLFRNSLLLLIFSTLLSWILGLKIYEDFMKISGSSGVSVRLPWCAYWFAMFVAMVYIPIRNNLGGAYL